ncbi:MAG TPA: superoxide dismutase [Thermoanaerobaculaceae bacterium]|nr:superoxide dismutase [Thermoanaerobaculaceae bacterium]
MRRAELPPLPYAIDALEPHYDAKTVEIHHGKHHQAYVTGFNNALDKLAAARAAGDHALVKHWQRELAFHGGGHALHSLFWTNLSPHGGKAPVSDLAAAISRDFGSFAAFDAHMRAATNAVEGSGWGALAVDCASGELAVLQVEKHQNQLLPGLVPIFVIDVWEHAYYLKYQNRRADWVDAVMLHLVNWPNIERRYEAAVKH